MNKKELIRTIAQEIDPSVSQDKLTMILNKTIEVMKRTLESGESVKWAGFGSLNVKEISSRRFYSPKLKKHTVSKGQKKIVFVPSRIK